MGVKTGVLYVMLLTAALMWSGGCAFQDDLVALNNRVISSERSAKSERAALRSEFESFREDQAKVEQDARSRHAELHAAVRDLRDEIGQLRGELERNQYGGKRLEESLLSTMDRVAGIERYLGMEPKQKAVTPDVSQYDTAEEDKGVQEPPEALFAKAKKRFEQGEYENARELFRSFLKQYPKSEMAVSAQFWLGEIYYHEKWYEKAILEYQKVIEDYPKGDKTPSALLKQGLAFLNLGDNANAGLILKELIRKFPGSNEANVAKNKLKTLK